MKPFRGQWRTTRAYPYLPKAMHRFPILQFAAMGLLLLLAGNALSAQTGATVPDTLNRLDERGRRQGWWRLQAPIADKPDYAPDKLVEEGRYTDNKRTGTWRRYWPDGQVRSEIVYVEGRPKGKYTTYYMNGKTEEQGTWDLDRNTGEFKRWHPNGNLAQEFIFDQYGTRDGEQKYYHENGRLEAVVNIKQGREQGQLKRYHANGDLESTALFNDGVAAVGSFKDYAPKRAVEEPVPVNTATAAPVKTAGESTNSTVFKAEGWNTLYDAQHRLAQQGHYRKGRLWEGKVYKYDRDGILRKVEVYIDGRYAGKAQLTEDDQ